MSDNKLDQTNAKFKTAVDKLAAVMTGAQHLKGPGKVANSAVSGIVDELIAEREAEAKTKVKDGLRKALDGYVALEKELKAKRDELMKLEIQKKEEYVKVIDELSKIIEDVDGIAAAYTKGLTSAPEITVEI